MSQRGETSNIPAGVLSDSIDRLLDERQSLEAAEATAYHNMLESQDGIPAGKKADREALAQAIRTKSAEPSESQAILAEEICEACRLRLAATRQALDHNRADLVSAFSDQLPALLAGLDEKIATQSDLAINGLATVEQACETFQNLTALRLYICQPTGNSENLRRYAARTLYVPIGQGRNHDPITASVLIDSLVARVRVGAPGVDMRIAIIESGMACDRVEIVRDQPLAWSRVPIDMAKYGLMVYRVVNGPYGVDVIVSDETNDATPITQLLRENVAAVAEAFQLQRRFVVTDPIAQEILIGTRGEVDRSQMVSDPTEAKPEPVLQVGQS